MPAKVSGGIGALTLGGAAGPVNTHYNGAIHQSAGFDEWTNLPSRSTLARYGTEAPNVTAGGGGPQWENGASGSVGNRGKGAVYFQGCRASFIGVAGNGAAPAPNDFYSRVRVTALTVKPVQQLVYPFAVWRLRVLMGVSSPAIGAITQDCGVLFLANSGITAYAGSFITNGANNQPGFGVFFSGAGNTLKWCSRAAAAGALTEQITLAATAPNQHEMVEVYIVSATPTTEAYVQVALNGSLVLTRPWGAGTVLPSRATFGTWGGTLTPFLRNNDSTLQGNVDLNVLHAELSAASSLALLR